jgi:cell division protein FtsZ
MVEFDRTLEREPAPVDNLKICVVGIGGGGLNVLDRISLDRMLDATVVAMHTDVRVLTHSMSAAKIQLGAEIMRGIGSGGDPELGREAAIASREKIKAVVSGHNMVFICCGLGGGTGSGAAPVVARIAKESGALVFVFATTPFVFEGRRRLKQAEVAMDELQQHVDALILFENNRMGELVLPKEGIQKAFSQADQLIGHSLRAIATMVTQPGIVRMGLADLMTALNSPNARCLFGFGEARGANRVADALKRSLKSPLVNQGQLLQNARNLLVHVAGGESLTLAEVESLMRQLSKCVPESTQIMFGLAVDPRMGDAISVTLVSSLSAQEMTSELVTEHQQKAEETPGDETKVAPQASAQEDLEREPEPAVKAEVEPPAVPLVEQKVEAKEVPVAVQQAPVAKAEPAPAPVAPSPKFEVVRGDLVERDLFGAELVDPTPIPAPQPEAKPQAVVSATAAQVRITIPKQVQEEVPVASEPAPAPVAAVRNDPAVVETPAPPAAEARPTVQVQESVAAPAPVSAPAKSIFSVIDHGDDEEDEDVEQEDEQDNHVDAHWADKYAKPAPAAPVQANEVKVRERESAMASTTASTPAGFKQGSFNLNQDEAGRFKGTSKTIVEGEDLDVPTWMRLKQKRG